MLLFAIGPFPDAFTRSIASNLERMEKDQTLGFEHLGAAVSGFLITCAFALLATLLQFGVVRFFV